LKTSHYREEQALLPGLLCDMTSRLAAQPGLAAEQLFQNGGCCVEILWGQISWDRMHFGS